MFNLENMNILTFTSFLFDKQLANITQIHGSPTEPKLHIS